MPRKSKALRLQQATDLVVGYSAAGIKNNSFRFMTDMISSMQRGKYPSKRQREWLDKLIDEGVPTPKEPSARYEAFSRARTIFLNEGDKQWEANVVGDFMHRDAQGWKLSEKQVALIDRLIVQAEKISAGENQLHVTDEMRAMLVAACNLWKGYAPMWRAERPAVSRAREKALVFLSGEGYIEQYHYDKIINAMNGKLKKFNANRFNIGDIGYTKGLSKNVWICASDVYISAEGHIVNDWIDHNGLMVTKPQDNIGKR